MKSGGVWLIALLFGACGGHERSPGKHLTVGQQWSVGGDCAAARHGDGMTPPAELFTVVSAADCYYCRDHLAAFDVHGEVADELRHRVGLYAPRGRAVEALAALMRQTQRLSAWIPRARYCRRRSQAAHR